MRLDERIQPGSRVLVRRQFEAEVIAVADDRQSCQVRPINKLPAPPPLEGAEADEVAPPGAPPMIVSWNEIKLADTHL